MTPIPAPPMPASNSVRNRPWADTSKARAKRLSILALRLIILLLLLTGNVSHPKAQETYLWSKQERIPEYYQLAQEPPYLIADQNNTVHAFNSQHLDLDDDSSPKVVSYRQWTRDDGWTYPNDILYDPPGGDLDVLDVTSDESGKVYLIFQKDFQDVYFTYAYLANAGNSTAWSYPVLLGRQSTHVSIGFEGVGAIAATKDGNIVVVYSGAEYGSGLYALYSTDHGDTWSYPYPIYLTGDESVVVTDPDLALGKSGIVHGVWSTFKSDGFAGPGFYAGYDSTNQTWGDSVELDTPGIRTPSVIEHDGTIFVSYYHFSTNSNWWRRSVDGGKTWTGSSNISPNHIGTNGRVSFVVDSENTLHGFFGERINDLNHGLWQITWSGASWTVPAAVVKGPSVRDVTGGNGFDPRSARAVVSNGNVILVTWTTDGFAGGNGAWYSYKSLNIPSLPSVENPNPVLDAALLPAPTPVTLETIEVNSTPPGLMDQDDRQPSRLYDPQLSIFSGVIFAAILLVGVLILKVRSQSEK